MARADLHSLYDRLMSDRFRFMARGEHSIGDLHREVKSRYREFCDDSYLCRDNCSRGHKQPEWQHTVRRSLSSLKRQGTVSRGSYVGSWQF
jgi:hypothetical protein